MRMIRSLGLLLCIIKSQAPLDPFSTLPPCGCPSVARRSRPSERAPALRPPSLRGLDSSCSVESQPAPEGTRSRRCGRRLTDITAGQAHVWQQEGRGTASAAPAGRATRAAPSYVSPWYVFLERCTDLSGMTFFSSFRLASNSRGVGPAGVGTSANFSMRA